MEPTHVGCYNLRGLASPAEQFFEEGFSRGFGGSCWGTTGQHFERFAGLAGDVLVVGVAGQCLGEFHRDVENIITTHLAEIFALSLPATG